MTIAHAIEEPFHLSLYANDAGALTLLEAVEIQPLASGTKTHAIPVEGVLLECDEDNNLAAWVDVICAGAS